jgi:uncharacterized protein (DUF849 family)
MNVLVQGALNGPNAAMAPDTLAREARSACNAGARSLHIHPYGADGRESVTSAIVAAVIAAVRGACPGVEIGISTGAWITDDMPSAIRAWRDPLPDMASVNLSESHHREVMNALLQRGIGIEAGVFTPSDVETLKRSGLTRHCRRILVEVFGANDAQATEAAEIDAALDAAGIFAIPRLHHGEGLGTWNVLHQAITRSIDVRTGIEDTTILPDGTPTTDNGVLVAATVALTTTLLSPESHAGSFS